MTERIERALADLRAQQQAGERMPCPRCGHATMKEPIWTNALSREAVGIYVCDACGTAVSLLLGGSSEEVGGVGSAGSTGHAHAEESSSGAGGVAGGGFPAAGAAFER